MTKFLGKAEVIDRLRRMDIFWKERSGLLEKKVSWADQMDIGGGL